MKDNATLSTIKFLNDLDNFIEVERDMPGGGRVSSLDEDGDDDYEVEGDHFDPVPEAIMKKLESIHDAVSLTLPLLKLAEEYMMFKINDSVFNRRWDDVKDAVEEVQVEINHESAAPTVQRLLDKYHGDETNE